MDPILTKKSGRGRVIAKFLFMLSTGIFFLNSCATKPTISISHKPREASPLLMPAGKPLALLLVQVRGSQDKVWYQIEHESWFLEKEPVTIVKEALEAELKGMGLHITDDLSLASGRLEVEIRWFAPYGHSYLTAAVILSLALYREGSENPIWRGRLQGGEYVHPPVIAMGGCAPIIEEIANTALSRAVEQLRWRPGFAEAMRDLARFPFENERSPK